MRHLRYQKRQTQQTGLKENLTRFSGNEATRYGQQAEPLARQCFEQTTGFTVETTGLVVHDQENWLGASLDGIITDTDRDTILEIKCPTAKKLEAHGGSLLKMIDSNKYDVRLSDGKYILRETASGLGYYYQVQVAMRCAVCAKSQEEVGRRRRKLHRTQEEVGRRREEVISYPGGGGEEEEVTSYPGGVGEEDVIPYPGGGGEEEVIPYPGGGGEEEVILY